MSELPTGELDNRGSHVGGIPLTLVSPSARGPPKKKTAAGLAPFGSRDIDHLGVPLLKNVGLNDFAAGGDAQILGPQ